MKLMEILIRKNKKYKITPRGMEAAEEEYDELVAMYGSEDAADYITMFSWLIDEMGLSENNTIDFSLIDKWLNQKIESDDIFWDNENDNHETYDNFTNMWSELNLIKQI